MNRQSDQSPKGRDPQGLDAKHESGGDAQRQAPSPCNPTPLPRQVEDGEACKRCGNRREVPDEIDYRSYPEKRPCPDCTDGTWVDVERLRASTRDTAQRREAIEAIFAERVDLQAKRVGESPIETESPGTWRDRVRQAAILSLPSIATIPDPVAETVERLDAAARALYKAYEEKTDQHVADIWEWAVSHPDDEVRRSCAQTVEEMRDWAAKVLAALEPLAERRVAATIPGEEGQEACAVCNGTRSVMEDMEPEIGFHHIECRACKASPKPCPFCGEALVYDPNEGAGFWVHCNRLKNECWLADCYVIDEPDGEGGIDEWNKRAQPTPSLDVSGVLEAMGEASAACERVRDESTHSDLMSEDYRRGFHAGSNGCVIAVMAATNALTALKSPPSLGREGE